MLPFRPERCERPYAAGRPCPERRLQHDVLVVARPGDHEFRAKIATTDHGLTRIVSTAVRSPLTLTLVVLRDGVRSAAALSAIPSETARNRGAPGDQRAASTRARPAPSPSPFARAELLARLAGVLDAAASSLCRSSPDSAALGQANFVSRRRARKVDLQR